MTTSPSKPELAAELEDLRARLAEAEEVLRAIRDGDVDAVVVAGERGEQVYTLSGADRIYRQLIEAMSEGAVTLSADGVIHYANQTFARLLQTPLERVIGAEFRAFVSPADQPVLADLIEAAWGGSNQGEVSVRAPDGSSVPLRLGLSRLQLDPETLVCVVATDLTETRKKEEELYRLRVDLEKRVEERTADLAASRLAALNMMEDAVEARQVAEASNRDLQQEMAERKRAEENIAKLNRLYATLSGINTAIVHAASPADLYDRVCEVAVTHGRFSMAWIGTVDRANQVVTPVAHRGLSPEDMAAIRDSVGRIAPGRGRTATAIRESRAIYTNDYDPERAITPWHAQAVKRGIRGSATLPIKQGGEIVGVLKLYVREQNFFDPEQLALLEEMRTDVSFAMDRFDAEAKRMQSEAALLESEEKLRRSLEETIRAVALTVEMRDPYTAGHQRRVADLAVAIAKELGLPEEQVHGLHLAGIIHDLGKIHVPGEILSKPGKLRDIEFSLIKTHSQAGYDILKDVAFPWPIAQIVLQHHERLDGSGYPQGLKAEQILLEARILAVADVIEAMSSHRPYRPALGIEKALTEIERGRGTVYETDVADACLRLFREKGYAIPV